MENNNSNLQAAVANINANAQAINALRAKAAGADMYEAAQMLLIDKFNLSQTETAEIVDGIKAGLETYKSTQASMAANREVTVRVALDKAVEGMTNEESVRYLASMLSSLELASANTELSQEAIDAKLDSNLTKTPAELTDAIVAALDNLPLDTLSDAARTLDAKTIATVAAAIDKNSDEFRFMAALQLYIAQREGTFKSVESSEPLTPNVIGALASGAVDAMLATAELEEGKITLTRWQEILKVILGTLFIISASVLACFGMAILCAPLTMTVLGVLGTGFLSTLVTMLIVIPVMSYGLEKTMPYVVDWVEKLAPVYDKVIVKVTAIVKDIFAKVSNWVKAHIVEPIKARTSAPEAANETAGAQTQPAPASANNIPANA